MTRRYFEEEMRYLHEAGKVFAETHPEQGRYLNVDSIDDRDPYVERLFEGFAFLTGRIREHLDDELPQYTESLCNLLFPHLARPLPALALVELSPKTSEVQATTLLPKGTEVRAQAVGEEKTVCRFVTTQPVRLQPLSVQNVALDWATDGTSSATLTFRLEGGASLDALELNPLRLHFHADPLVASAMHLFFTRHVTKVTIDGGETGAALLGADAALTLHGQQWITPGGLDDQEGLLPYAPNTFSGFRLLQEYFAFRRKFWCIDLHGLQGFRPQMAGAALRVRVDFDRAYPEERRFRKDNVRLFCTPVVNLFAHDAEPIRVDHQHAEYRVLPNARRRGSIEVYDVLRGVGIEDKTGKRHSYLPLYSFEAVGSDARYYTASARIGPTDRYETFVMLETGDLAEGDLATETLSLDVRCTNGSLPRERLQERMIDQLAPEVPKIAQPANLTQPTLILYPPTTRQKDFFWQMISHWSLNYQTLASKEALAGLLALYDWSVADTANQRRIAGIEAVRWEPKERMHRGTVLRGAEVHVKLQESHFADEGDICLFGLILSNFLSMYATINAFVHLTIETMPTGQRYQWQPKTGTRPVV